MSAAAERPRNLDAAPEPFTVTGPMTEPRLVACPECDGLGEWDEGPINTAIHGGSADSIYRQVKCPECEGTGRVIVETQPIEMEDLP